MHSTLKKYTSAFMLIAGLGTASLSAQSIINGDFENTNISALPVSQQTHMDTGGRGYVLVYGDGSNGTIDGWSTSVGSFFVFLNTTGLNTWTNSRLSVYEGDFVVGLQSTGSLVSIRQTLTDLSVGENYTVSLYAAGRGASSLDGTLSITLNDGVNTSTLFTGHAASTTEWGNITTSFLASTTSATLSIAFITDSGDQTVFVDKITLGLTAIPEPSTTAVLLGAASLMVVATRKRKRA